MFPGMKKIKEQMTEEEVKAVLEQELYGVLSTMGENGFPYGVPVNYVYWNGAIYIHGAKKGHKVENIQHCNKVSFCIVKEHEVIPSELTANFESVILFGTMTEVSGKEKEDALMEIVKKFSSDYLEQGKKVIQKMFEATCVMKVDIAHMTGKAKH